MLINSRMISHLRITLHSHLTSRRHHTHLNLNRTLTHLNILRNNFTPAFHLRRHNLLLTLNTRSLNTTRTLNLRSHNTLLTLNLRLPHRQISRILQQLSILRLSTISLSTPQHNHLISSLRRPQISLITLQRQLIRIRQASHNTSINRRRHSHNLLRIQSLMNNLHNVRRLRRRRTISTRSHIILNSSILTQSIRRLLRRISLTTSTMSMKRRRHRTKLRHVHMLTRTLSHMLRTLQSRPRTLNSNRSRRRSRSRNRSKTNRQNDLN